MLPKALAFLSSEAVWKIHGNEFFSSVCESASRTIGTFSFDLKVFAELSFILIFDALWVRKIVFLF